MADLKDLREKIDGIDRRNIRLRPEKRSLTGSGRRQRFIR